MSLESSVVPAEASMRFAVAASLKKLALEAGAIELCLVQRLSDGTEKLIGQRTVDGLARKESWVPSSFTMDSSGPGLRDDGPVRLVVRGSFSGEILLRSCRITRKKAGRTGR